MLGRHDISRHSQSLTIESRTYASRRQMFRPERLGQQFAEREARAHALGSGDMDGRARAGEFANPLPATAAGRAEPVAVADDENFSDASFARQRHGADRARFRARALRVGGVLDVAAGIDRATRRAYRGADMEARIWGVGLDLRRSGCVEQRGERAIAL